MDVQHAINCVGDVRASLNPGLRGNEALLGMNILKKMELIQRGDTLILRKLK